MENLLIVLIVFLVIAVGTMTYFLFKLLKTQNNGEEKKDDNSFLLIQNQLNELMRTNRDLTKTLDMKIGESSKMMNESSRNQSQESQKLIKEMIGQMTEIKETNKQVFSMTEQLQNLEKVLKNQKQRGNLGESGLELILNNILPPTAFQMQYSFKDGDIVDAVIFTKDGIIPVDAKFSLDNYNRITNEENENRKIELEKDFKNDLKKRIDETSKYIKPKEGTLPFAIMYIPAEAIYYDLLVNEVGAVKVNTRDLIDYAFIQKKVVIVSPTTFAAYLQTVLQGLRALKIEEGAKSIRKDVESLGKHIRAYEEFMKKLGGSLGTTVNHYNTAYKELAKVDKDVEKITEGERAGIEPLKIEGPEAD